MPTHHRIFIGDSRQMTEVEDRSIHLVVTSPPYWQLKDYGRPDQIGFHDSYEDYIDDLNLVWMECRRVLHPGCRLCINIGDQFARAAYYGRYKVIPIRTEIIRFCETIGFDYMGAIIWQKATTCNTSGGAVVMGSYPHPRNGVVKIDYEFILLFRKQGRPPVPSKEVKEKSRLTREQWNEYFYGHWTFPGARSHQHLAPFPLELPSRLIRMFSFVGETVLDPFLGSGTTTLAARNLERNSVGYEINEQCADVIRERLGWNEPCPVTGDSHAIQSASAPRPPLDEARARLPYRFHDPLQLSLQVDPKQRTYGSRIDGSETPDRALYTVRAVLAPDLIQLDDDRQVRLLGIRPRVNTARQAVDYLTELVQGQKVFLRQDEGAGEETPTRAYVYLKNRTFINRRLLQSGLVAVDEESDYSRREQFIRLARGEKDS